ncbi:hypothetical protein [Streptomyces sp. NPDC046805]|uniref:hypothetical protein n=1 Tax=Streptomyces sp. NPDC046805 TaxID=3155134 RepID=UPI0034055A3F
MPSTEMTQHPTLAHRILQHTHALLVACEAEEALPLAELLARAEDCVRNENHDHTDPTALAWAAAEAAIQLLARCKIFIGPADSNVRPCL